MLEPAAAISPPPPRQPRVAAALEPNEPRCTMQQHVWLKIPHDWRCACGENIIVDGPDELTALAMRTNLVREDWGLKAEASDLRKRAERARQEKGMDEPPPI